MTERKLKVTAESRRNKRNIYSHSVAGLRISGRWLEMAGFRIGECISVLVTSNYIQIIKDTTPKREEQAQ